jgi:predicted metal-dependent HD superfamily phosphohydrolase
MNTLEKSKNQKTLEELKKEQGKTCWAKLIAEDKSANKKIQSTQKMRS